MGDYPQGLHGVHFKSDLCLWTYKESDRHTANLNSRQPSPIYVDDGIFQSHPFSI
jgi:hypothetical protein